jgi:hypothetical protein
MECFVGYHHITVTSKTKWLMPLKEIIIYLKVHMKPIITCRVIDCESR